MPRYFVDKPRTAPSSPFSNGDQPLHIEGDWIWVPLKGEWRSKGPEELVRQEFIYRLYSYYGYKLDQMDQERRTMHGRGSPRADIIVCKNADALRENRDYVIAVECKSDKVTIVPSDYNQGESYARSVGCEFLATHNNKETRFFRLIPGAPGRRDDIEDIPRAADLGDAKRLEEIRRATKAFTREEFRRLLYDCHCILRDNHKMDPGRAFDEISKILFIKMWIERTGDHSKFTEGYLDKYADIRRKRIEEVMNDLFDDTKEYYNAEELFAEEDRLTISFETFRRIVKKLERFNLSATSDDIKGIAFERFLGETFRGELGQFFTPRPIVDFMVEMLDPKEGEIICDPASGSGGFLIKCFEYVRSALEADIQKQKETIRADLARQAEEQEWDEQEETRRLNEAFETLNKELDVQEENSRLFSIAHECIFGVDAEPRAARTSKMNMIMHGDGHGGIHHHDGLVDVNGIFPERFDVVITNPPFGSTVRDDQKIGTTEETRITTNRNTVRQYERRFGKQYKLSYERMVAAVRNQDPILKLYDIGRDPIGGDPATSKVRNSRLAAMLFLERCINLLKPGGRMGIVLPDGFLNNPSHQWLRDYIEGRAKIRAVVSIPQDVFASANATIKPSLVFLQRFTTQEEQEWNHAWEMAWSELGPIFEARRQSILDDYNPRIDCFEREDVRQKLDLISFLEDQEKPDEELIDTLQKELKAMITISDRKRQRELIRERDAELKVVAEEEAKALRARTKEIFDYPFFMVEVENAGITATGATGAGIPNELPEVVSAFRAFSADPEGFESQIMAELLEGVE